MAARDYYRCKNCNAKIIYGPDRSDENWEPFLLCRECISALQSELEGLKKECVDVGVKFDIEGEPYNASAGKLAAENGELRSELEAARKREVVLRDALLIAEKFVENEQSCRELSCLPEPLKSEEPYLQEAEDTIVAIRAALAQTAPEAEHG